MKFKEIYSFSNSRQIWRIIPAGDHIIIEEREPNTKEVYFNCINLNTGKVLFRNYQLEEKFWVGVEVVYNGIIYFHKFGKPDMPGHKEIIAVDLLTLEQLWINPGVTFLFAYDEKIYSFINLFEGREYYLLDYRTGELLETYRDPDININKLKTTAYDDSFYQDAHFPEQRNPDDPGVQVIIKEIKKPVVGRLECIEYQGFLLTGFHTEESPGVLMNTFTVVEINSENIIFKEILNNKTSKIIPDNFFIKGNKVMLIKEKSVLKVYSLR